MSDALFAGLAPNRLPPAGAHGVAGTPGVVVTLRDDLAVATLAPRKGAGAALAGAVQASFGAALIDGPKVSPGTAVDFIGVGPGRWLAVAANRPGLASELTAALGAHAAITEQSDANLAIDISGPRVREALAKGVAIDLDPVAFASGDAAVTSVALVGVTFWQIEAAPRALSDQVDSPDRQESALDSTGRGMFLSQKSGNFCGTCPSYRFLVGRSFAAGFVRFLVAGAAEFGLRLDDALSGNLPGRG